MKEIIIGLTGFKQVGKSTAASHLETKHGFSRHNMKDALVAELRQNFPDLLQKLVELEYPSRMFSDKVAQQKWIDQAWIDQLFLDKPPLMRALMQNYGTEVRRKDNPDYWVNQWKKNSYANELIVVDDVRFENEGRAVRDRGGIIIQLTRPDIASGGTHASEQEALDIKADYTISVAKGDHEGLYRQLDTIVKGLNKPSLLEQSDYDEGIKVVIDHEPGVGATLTPMGKHFDELEEAIEEYATQPVSKAEKNTTFNKMHEMLEKDFEERLKKHYGVADDMEVSDSDSNTCKL